MRIELRTSTREQFVDITSTVAEAVAERGARTGAALIYCPHTTAGITVNEHADPDVVRDILGWLAEASPRSRRWHHFEGNADAHVKASLVGSSVLVPLEDGRLALGTWQGIFFCEFDGPRSRHFEVQVLAGAG